MAGFPRLPLPRGYAIETNIRKFRYIFCLWECFEEFIDRSISNENALPQDLFQFIVTLRDYHDCKKSK